MKPEPDRRIGFVKAEYASAAGLIKSHWTFDRDEWKWNFTVPKGTEAYVTIPGESEPKIYGPGDHYIVKSL